MKIQPTFILIDFKYNLIRCEIGPKSGRVKWRPEDRFSYGEFPSMPVIYCNPYELWFLYNEIKCCKAYRQRCCTYIRSLKKVVVIKMEPAKKEALDYHW